MDTSAAGPSNVPTLPLHSTTIKPGNTILLKIPTGDVKSAKIDENTVVSLGKFGSFFANELIGQPYGLTHEILDKRLKIVPPKSIVDIEDTDATNELINDGEFVQPLTSVEIEALKQSGAHASDIIKKQIEMHANYALKTEYSKEKYKKRKEAKYSKSFTTIEPTLFNVCEYWYNKDQPRIRDLRVDTLSQLLNLANIRPGGRYIAVDDASGMIVSAILERLGGNGRLITICDVDSPPAYPVLTQMNFPAEFVAPIMSSLNWATADEEYTPIMAPIESTSTLKSEKHKARMNKRKAVSDTLNSTRQELFTGGFEGLIVASEYEPFSIVDRLAPYLAGSASIVIHSPHLQILTDLQSKLRQTAKYLAPSITESWLRRYQVLPGRTHPMMVTSGSGGFLLHTIKVHDNPSAMPVAANRAKKLKVSSSTPTVDEVLPAAADPLSSATASSELSTLSPVKSESL